MDAKSVCQTVGVALNIQIFLVYLPYSIRKVACHVYVKLMHKSFLKIIQNLQSFVFPPLATHEHDILKTKI
jgi:hypothetical protein